MELMDATQQFIANDYCLLRGQSAFQIVTGPNMVRVDLFINDLGVVG